MRRTFATCVATLLTAGPAMAATLWVSPGGDDTLGDGRSCRPYRTIQKAVNVSLPGDVIRVRAGEYSESSVSLVDRGHRQIIGDGRDTTILHGSFDVATTTHEGSTDLQISRMTFAYFGTDNGPLYSSGVTLSDNRIGPELSVTNRVFTGRLYSRVRLLRNEIDGGHASQYGVFLNGTFDMYHRAEGNTIRNVTYAGILTNWAWASDILNNLIEDVANYGIRDGNNERNNDFVANTIVDSGSDGISLVFPQHRAFSNEVRGAGARSAFVGESGTATVGNNFSSCAQQSLISGVAQDNFDDLAPPGAPGYRATPNLRGLVPTGVDLDGDGSDDGGGTSYGVGFFGDTDPFFGAADLSSDGTTLEWSFFQGLAGRERAQVAFQAQFSTTGNWSAADCTTKKVASSSTLYVPEQSCGLAPAQTYRVRVRLRSVDHGWSAWTSGTDTVQFANPTGGELPEYVEPPPFQVDPPDADQDGVGDDCEAESLVAYYPFNGNANDESGNANHGTVHGAVLVADRCGLPGSAYTFDGVNDRIVFGASPVLNVSGPDKVWSAGAWVRARSGTSSHFFAKNDNSAHGWNMTWASGHFIGRVEAASGTNSYNVTTTTSYGLDQWHFVYIVWDGRAGQTAIKIYVDGVLQPATSAGTYVAGSNYDNSGNLSAGSPDLLLDFFDGVIDDLRLYRGRISDAELQLLAAESCADQDGDGYGAAADCDDNNPNVHPGATEVCDGLDNDCDESMDEGVPTPPGPLVLAVTRAEFGGAVSALAWTTVPMATGYDVVRGNLFELWSSGGDFSVATQSCLVDDQSRTTLIDADPPTEEGFWYLVRPTNCGGAGTYDDPSLRQSGPRDAEIAASGMGCP